MIKLRHLLPAIIVVGIIGAGCVSTQKRFEKGVDLEEKGRLVEAADYYIRVLNDDPEFGEARERLTEIGPIIVDDWMESADRKTAANLFVEAFDQYGAVESFIQRCGYVGVGIPRPENLDELKLAADRKAFEQLLTRAAGASAEGNFAKAIDEYSRARAWPTITEEERESINMQIADVEYVWALRLFDDRQFRAAFEHTESALALVAPTSELHARLIDLQERTVADGSVIVAYLPLGQTEEVSRKTSSYFADDINDVLLYEYWSIPPVFLVTADPVDVRREMRRITGRNARIVSSRDAIEIGRVLDADFVVAGEINRYEEDEDDVRERTYETQTRGRNPVDTTYVVRRSEIERKSRVAFRIFDVRRRNTAERGTVTADAKLEVERGVYAGDYSQLDLDGNQFAVFDPDEIRRQDEQIDEQLADELAARLADKIVEALFKRIP